MIISKFCVYGLFNRHNVEIPLLDNRLVVVGVNGLGKSTVLSIFYYFISQRWAKLGEFPFERASITVDGELFEIARADVNAGQSWARTSRNFLPLSIIRRIENSKEWDLLSLLSHDNNSVQDLERAAAHFRIPQEILLNARSELARSNPDGDLGRFVKVRDALKAKINSTVLFMPTYRRIEKDLSTIVPNIEEQVRQFEERASASKGLATLSEGAPPSFIDLIQFGMKDVSNVIQTTLNQLNNYARAKLNELAGLYLRDVIRGGVEDFKSESVTQYSEDEIRTIMDRVSEGSLDAADKEILQETIRRLQTAPGDATERDKYVAHYFGKLVEFTKALEKLEAPIAAFVRVCNSNYLVDKKIVYDSNSFKLSIRRVNGAEIKLNDLSSGEKQVVSLFCHLYLGVADSYIILIDEPELSLSVDWQQSLLPDIWATGRCSFLFAVTHSPFIYENDFDPYAIDLSQYTQALS